MPTGSFLSIAGASMLALCLLSPALAQTAAEPPNKDTGKEQIIVSGTPEQQSRMRKLLNRLFGDAKTEKLKNSGSEVLSVPKEQSSALQKRLEKLGAKVTKLRENWNHLLTRRKPDDKPLTPEQQAAVDKAAKPPETMNVGVLRMPNADVAELALTRFEQSVGTKGRAGPQDDPYAKVILPLSDGTPVTLVRKRPPDFMPGGVTWVGETETTGERAVLMLWKDGHLSGYFGYKGRVFTVNHVGGDVHAMAEIDPRKLPPDHAPDPSQRNPSVAPPAAPAIPQMPPEPQVAPFLDAERQALESKPIVIDVMLLFTKKVADSYIRNPDDLATLAIEQTNETFRNSGLGNIKLRLVHNQLVDYDETGVDLFDSLYRMVDGTGAFKDLKKLRNEKRADVVGLILDSPSGCGQSTRGGADADEAFFAVHHSCAAITFSIAHEIGHIIGTRHDRIMDNNNNPYAFAHGYINGTKWRDMMSYQEGCGGCPRIPYWSNPRILYQGEPTGTAASDNARLILEQAERVSKFR
jgi:hypothetical protein